MLRASFGTAIALLGALGATAAGTLTANASSVAEPAADTFSVVSAAASPSSPDQLIVVVDSPSTVTDLTAQFLTGAGSDAYDQVLALQSSETDPADATQTQTTWVANIPAGTDGLALGGYGVSLSGTFADTTTYALANVTSFSFDATSAVTLVAANTSLSYPDDEPGLSGAVTFTYPDGSNDTDYTGAKVLILSGNQEVQSLPVASDGTFSDPTYEPPASESIVAEVTGDRVAVSQSAPVTLTVTATKPALGLKVNPVTDTYGKSVTITGTLTYLSGATAKPLAGQEIWIGGQQWDWSSPLVTGKTGTDGSFAITLPTQQIATTLYVGTTNQAALAAVETPLQVNVIRPTVISGFKVSLNQSWALSVSGCLGYYSGDASQGFYHTSGLTVQYASSTAGPWKNLFAINGNEPVTSCGIGGIRFTGSHTAPENYAYYRVVYAGTSGATRMAPTTSSNILTWRYVDRITGFKVSPTVVNAGGKLTVKGTLQYYYYGWRNYSGQLIWINLRPKGGSTWYWMVKVKTNSKGQFSASFQDPVSATWDAVFEGNNTAGGHLSYGSPEVYVRLK